MLLMPNMIFSIKTLIRDQMTTLGSRTLVEIYIYLLEVHILFLRIGRRISKSRLTDNIIIPYPDPAHKYQSRRRYQNKEGQQRYSSVSNLLGHSSEQNAANVPKDNDFYRLTCKERKKVNGCLCKRR
jgi:hypothetical protein